MTNKLLAFTFLLVLMTASRGLASDMTSTNYTVSKGAFTAGAADVSSTNYDIDEGALDFIAKDDLSSTNYKVDGNVGIDGGASDIPVLTSISPGPKADFIAGDTVQYTVTATNPGTGTLEYQLKEDTSVKVAWQTSNVISYSVTGGDFGRHDLEFEIKNNEGSTISNDIQFIYYKPKS